ncbi:MAG TPA: hypothetical protein DCG57_20305 [Candidatus Riflebacteria bacterium]|nr:hypothetical protein [Candidatus Riflebacteria bacterium]
MKDKQVRRSYLFWLVISAVFAVFLTGMWLYFNVWLPNRELSDYSMIGLTTANDDFSPPHLRDICHRVISFPFGNHHDAFLVLEQHGNHESIPYLIWALKWQQQPDAAGTVTCATEHCVDILQKLTGKDFSFVYEDWQSWWQNEGSRLSPQDFEKAVADAANAENTVTAAPSEDAEKQ